MVWWHHVGDDIWHYRSWPTLIQEMACHLLGAKKQCWLIVNRTFWNRFQRNSNFFIEEMHLKMLSSKWQPICLSCNVLTHWGQVTYICISKLTIIGSDKGLSPGRHQAIIWTNDGILSIWPWGANFSEMLTKIQTSSFNKMHLKMSVIYQPFCLSLNTLIVTKTP